MANLGSLRVGGRIALAFALVVALAVASGVFSLWQLAKVHRLAQDLTVAQAQRQEVVYRWREDTSVNSGRAVVAAMMTDPTLAAPIKSQMAATSLEIGRLQKQLDALETSPQGRGLLSRLATTRQHYLALRKAMLQGTGEAGSIAAAVAKGQAIQAYNAAFVGYSALQDQLVAYEQSRTTAGGAAITEAVDRSGLVSLGCAIVSVLASLMAGWLLQRSIVGPVRAARTAADRIAAGDLTADCQAQGRDEVAELVGALGRMQQALAGMVRDIRGATESIHGASGEVAAGNQDLSTRTEQTAGSLQQAASSMEELAGAVRHSADAARQAHELATSASDIAVRGGEVVSRVVSTMGEINTSSQRIADIIGVIDGIAFQTNILALNAAVEAARAGEQGRGFAVVAGEVRTLAQRSAEAAREIKSLIGASVERVESGARQVQDAGSTMEELVAAVRRVGAVIGEITTSAAEQAGGISQVSEAVGAVDQMTQQNAALVEQSAAAAESMRQQAARLAQAVERFRTA